jgi:hypothetical protein
MENSVLFLREAKKEVSGLIREALTITLCGYLAGWSEPAFAFRPFDGTDATVAAPGGLEIELGPAGLRREGSERTLIAPAITLNFGVAEGWEAVLEGQRQSALSSASVPTSLVENGAFLKGVIRDGVLQDKSGPSIATEFGVLLPGVNDEAGLGASWAAIVSYRFGPATVHFNAEAALSRRRHGEIFLSAIVEGPYAWSVRPVAEIAYDREAGIRETSSILVGAIWQLRENIALDFGVREGRTNDRGLTEIRAGVAYTLTLWRPGQN